MADETVVVQELWPQVLEAVKKRRRFTWILLSQNANVSFYDGATLTLAWVNQGAVDNFVSSDSVPVLEAVLEEVLSRPAAVESVLEQTPPAPLYSMPASTAVPAHAPAATAALPPRPAASAVSTLHRVLGQTAFLMYEQGNSEAAALLADVGNVELIPGNCSGGGQPFSLCRPISFPGSPTRSSQPFSRCSYTWRDGMACRSMASVPLLRFPRSVTTGGKSCRQSWTRRQPPSRRPRRTPRKHPPPSAGRISSRVRHQNVPGMARPLVADAAARSPNGQPTMTSLLL